VSLHLLKLSVGSESVETMARWQAGRLARTRALFHETRNFPRRAGEILDGGSIYWIIKGHVRVRQRIIGLERREDEERGRVCRIMLDPNLIPTEIQPRRPHQGWRYLEADDAPPDARHATSADDPAPEMIAELRELGLL